MDPSSIWSPRINGPSSILSSSALSSPASLTSSLSFGIQPGLPTTSLLSQDSSPLGAAGELSRSGVSLSSLSLGAYNGPEDTSETEVLFNRHKVLRSPGTSDRLDDSLPSSVDEEHPLAYSWTIWFLHRGPGVKISDYEKATKEISSFSTVEDFWRLYSYLARPSTLPYTSEYHLFKTGVRPIWEDPTNMNGGKWILKLKKGTGSVHWESLLLAIIGGEFGESLADEVVGAVISIRREGDIISLWNRHGNNGSANLKIRDIIKNVLGLNNVTIEYKVHADSMKEGAEKMAAAKAAAASGDKGHRGRGGHHSVLSRAHTTNSLHTVGSGVSSSAEHGSLGTFGSGRGRGTTTIAPVTSSIGGVGGVHKLHHAADGLGSFVRHGPTHGGL
ncbi:translation initiation factor eIF 4e-like domain-containing protein [Limtongia smithiae]|uniref:translation initiation factor eIF 4e-like domain-containing protein n=1 Tax=Limtongia smithiae TaxID=1125753 RepID=UPI0034CDE4CE